MEIGLIHYLFLSSFLFVMGILTMLSRRNVIAILLGVELIMNAAAINFVAFGKYVSGDIHGQVFATFIILVAAAEAAIGLAITLRLFQTRRTIEADKLTQLRN